MMLDAAFARVAAAYEELVRRGRERLDPERRGIRQRLLEPARMQDDRGERPRGLGSGTRDTRGALGARGEKYRLADHELRRENAGDE